MTARSAAVTIGDMEAGSEPTDAGPAAIHEIRVGVHCTAEQARDVVDSIQLMLCPDPWHNSPCPIPWTTAHRQLDELDAAERYSVLIEQVRIEQQR